MISGDDVYAPRRMPEMINLRSPIGLLLSLAWMGCEHSTKREPIPPPAATAGVNETGSNAVASAERPALIRAAESPMVLIPSANFRLDEGDPQRQIDIKEYWLDVTEVTVSAYKECVDAKACTPPRRDSLLCHAIDAPLLATRPVNCVDAFQARAFCRWLGKRLPSEDEWDAALYSAPPIPPAALMRCSSDGKRRACDVGETDGRKNADRTMTGVFDLRGNVSEWTSMVFVPFSPPAVTLANSQWTVKGPGFALQGMAIHDRRSHRPRAAYPDLGFRCAKGGRPGPDHLGQYEDLSKNGPVPYGFSDTEPELRARYEALWKRLLAKANNASVDTIEKSIKVVRAELERGEHGTTLEVLYEVTIGWATARAADFVKVRLDGSDRVNADGFRLPMDEWIAPERLEEIAHPRVEATLKARTDARPVSEMLELSRLPLGKKLKYATKADAIAALASTEYPGASFKDGTIEVARPQWSSPDLYLTAVGTLGAPAANQCVEVTLNLVTGVAGRHQTPCRIH